MFSGIQAVLRCMVHTTFMDLRFHLLRDLCVELQCVCVCVCEYARHTHGKMENDGACINGHSGTDCRLHSNQRWSHEHNPDLLPLQATEPLHSLCTDLLPLQATEPLHRASINKNSLERKTIVKVLLCTTSDNVEYSTRILTRWNGKKKRHNFKIHQGFVAEGEDMQCHPKHS